MPKPELQLTHPLKEATAETGTALRRAFQVEDEQGDKENDKPILAAILALFKGP